MEGLSEYRMGAVLITNVDGTPVGVVSKTDLALAYRHGRHPESSARTIMASPVRSCGDEEYLEAAIRKLIFSQIHRIFVYRDDPSRITGVLSLSDAARVRSGSCQACVSSRITVGSTGHKKKRHPKPGAVTVLFDYFLSRRLSAGIDGSLPPCRGRT